MDARNPDPFGGDIQMKNARPLSHELLRAGPAAVRLSARVLKHEQQEGVALVYTFALVCRRALSEAGSQADALARIDLLQQVFELNKPYAATLESEDLNSDESAAAATIYRALIDDPEIGVALRAWNQLETHPSFKVPRIYAREFLASLRKEALGTSFHPLLRFDLPLESLLFECYQSAGSLGLMICHVLGIHDLADRQGVVSLASALRLQQLAEEPSDKTDSATSAVKERLHSHAQTLLHSSKATLHAYGSNAPARVRLALHIFARLGFRELSRLQSQSKMGFVKHFDLLLFDLLFDEGVRFLLAESYYKFALPTLARFFPKSRFAQARYLQVRFMQNRSTPSEIPAEIPSEIPKTLATSTQSNAHTADTPNKSHSQPSDASTPDKAPPHAAPPHKDA
jgi:hypothetical protein